MILKYRKDLIPICWNIETIISIDFELDYFLEFIVRSKLL